MPETKTFPQKLTKIIVWFFGSWAGVIIHTFIFLAWFIFKWDLELLLVAVSLEAIYIGMFILMAENAESLVKERQEKSRREYQMKIIRSDAKIDEEAHRLIKKVYLDIDEIKQALKLKSRN